MSQGKAQELLVIDPVTTSDFDSAMYGGISSCTKSSEIELSESYL